MRSCQSYHSLGITLLISSSQKQSAIYMNIDTVALFTQTQIVNIKYASQSQR